MPQPRLDRARQFLRSNLLGLVAIFIVLGGTAIALPGKNKVDSGDIKQGAVRTLDLHREAVRKAKLHRNAVDGTRVRNNSLTDDDIDESTLELPPLKTGAVTEHEEADRERRIVIGAGELVPASHEEPTIILQFGVPAVFFQSAADKTVGAITEVPLDRAPSSGLQVRFVWEAAAMGDAIWNVGFRTAAAGADMGTGVQNRIETVASATEANSAIETTVRDIPPVALVNGVPLALSISRNADAPGDTLVGNAYLHLVEIRYTAAG
jgi:hypothetical protein